MVGIRKNGLQRPYNPFQIISALSELIVSFLVTSFLYLLPDYKLKITLIVIELILLLIAIGLWLFLEITDPSELVINYCYDY